MKLTVFEKFYDETQQATFQQNVFEPCCDDMNKADDIGYIGYGEHTEPVINELTKMSIYSFVPDNDTWLSIPINYCPFCSALIEIDFVKH